LNTDSETHNDFLALKDVDLKTEFKKIFLDALKQVLIVNTLVYIFFHTFENHKIKE
jgi:hypothetical protein